MAEYIGGSCWISPTSPSRARSKSSSAGAAAQQRGLHLGRAAAARGLSGPVPCPPPWNQATPLHHPSPPSSPTRDVLPRRSLLHRRVCVIRGRALPQPQRPAVALVHGHERIHRLGAPPHAHDEQAGGHGVQRACTAQHSTAKQGTSWRGGRGWRRAAERGAGTALVPAGQLCRGLCHAPGKPSHPPACPTFTSRFFLPSSAASAGRSLPHTSNEVHSFGLSTSSTALSQAAGSAGAVGGCTGVGMTSCFCFLGAPLLLLAPPACCLGGGLA